MVTRVIQWTTGAVGSISMGMILDNPELELVGVWVSSAAKHGKDAGELCGRPATGIIATSSKEEIYALDADIVMHNTIAVSSKTGAVPFDDDVIALLRSGKNVISSVAYFSPLIEGPERMKELLAACEAGQSTLFGTGIDPGFVCDRLPVLLSGSVDRIDRILLIESQDVSFHPSFDMMSEVGFGKRPEERDFNSPAAHYYGGRILRSAVARTADLFGIELDSIEMREELVLAPNDMDVTMGTIKKGTIIGVLAEFNGIYKGKTFITHQWVTFMGNDHMPAHWLTRKTEKTDVPPYVVRVVIEGRPNLQMDLVYTDNEDTTSFSSPTAAVCVNAIPEICAAPPGLFQEKIFGRWQPK